MDESTTTVSIPGVSIARLESNGQGVPLCCPGCGRELGHIVEHGGKLWLRAGPWLVAHGCLPSCPGCGGPVHFHRPSKPLERLLERYRARSVTLPLQSLP